jgi:chorismate synthase
MRGNTFGKVFQIHTFGESHGAGIGVILDGCPAGLSLDVKDIQWALDRRRPGQSDMTSPRQEADRVEILSGVVEGITLGTPIMLLLRNTDARSDDYERFRDTYRPSHADFTWDQKFGRRDYRGGGRSSARETAARVAAGAVAHKVLEQAGIRTMAWVSAIGPHRLDQDYRPSTITDIDASPTRCPVPATARLMEAFILELKEKGDSTGGVITCEIVGCPPGLGEPVFDKLHADLGKAMLSINACKGFEVGSGFEGSRMTGSTHNDVFVHKDETILTRTNQSGGIQGGISNGMPIRFRCAFKPVATIRQNQETVSRQGETVTLSGEGRHDPCVVPRAVPIVEAMAALVIADHLLRQRSSLL